MAKPSSEKHWELGSGREEGALPERRCKGFLTPVPLRSGDANAPVAADAGVATASAGSRALAMPFTQAEDKRSDSPRQPQRAQAPFLNAGSISPGL